MKNNHDSKDCGLKSAKNAKMLSISERSFIYTAPFQNIRIFNFFRILHIFVKKVANFSKEADSSN